MSPGLHFEPLAPALVSGPVGIALAAVALIVALVGLWRRPLSGAFRLAALAALFGLLANPVMRTAEQTPLDDLALLIVDRSASQSLDGRDAAATEAAADVERKLAGLGGVDVRRIEVAGATETRLGAAIEGALADAPRSRLAGVFVVTDGQSADAIRADAAPADAPVHAILTGRADEIDRKITVLNGPRYGIVGDPAPVSFRIDDVGRNGVALTGARTADVVLRVDGDEILRESVAVGAEIGFNAPLARPGRLVIELEVEPLDGELTARNNIAVLSIAAVRDRLRVLLISGEPHAGERVWRNLLKSDPAIDLVHFTILRPIEKAQSDRASERELALIEFPQDELFIDKLAEFHLVIFDRYTYRGVLNAYHFDNIARYVEGGGAVLVASGPEFNGYLSLAARRNLAFILPAMPTGAAIEGAFRPQIAEAGRRHPVTADLPDADFWGRWLRIMPVAQRSGQKLMEGPGGEALLILDRVGEGRVGLLQSDHVWLWARGFDGGGPHGELLRRIAHWLMKEPDLEEEQLSLSAAGDDLVIERRTLADETAPVSLTDPDGATREVTLDETAPGRFASRLPDMAPGLYRARSGDLFAVGAIGAAAAREFQDVVSTSAAIRPLAEATGGGVFDARRPGAAESGEAPELRRVGARAPRSGDRWAGIVTRGAMRTDSVRDAPLASPLAWLTLLAAALGLAWWTEGRRSARGRGRA